MAHSVGSGHTDPHRADSHLPSTMRAAAAARKWVAQRLGDWGHESMTPTAALVVSELVTNAVLHGAEPIEISLQEKGPMVRLEVSDGGTGGIIVRAPDPIGEGGRGLRIVDGVSATWGVRPQRPAGKVVWVDLGVAAECG